MDTAQLSRFLAGLGRLSAEAAILVVLVVAAQSAFRKHLSPRWRCALWLLLAARLLMPFSFSSVTSVFNLLPDWPRPHASTPIPTPETAIASALESPAVITPLPLRNTPAPEPAPPPPIQPTQPPSPSWPVWIFGAWLGGVILLAGQVLVSSVRLWKRYAELQPLTNSAALAALDDCRRQLKVRTRPVLLENFEIKSPALHGLIRPRLLLPKGFIEQFSLAELRFVFLHELAHLKRRDLLANWLMAALQIIHWFNPLVWFGFGRWRADREIACDAMALEAAGQEHSKLYGQTILRLLENFSRPISTPGLVGILEDKRQLRRRIHMIANYAPAGKWPVLALLLATGLAAIGLTDARNQSSNAAPSIGKVTLLNGKKAQFQVIGVETITDGSPTNGNMGANMTAPATSTDGGIQLNTPIRVSADGSNWIALNNSILSNSTTGSGTVTITADVTNRIAWNATSPRPSPLRSSNPNSQEGTPAATASSDLANELIGAWVLVGTPGKVGPAPKEGGRIKFYTGKYYCMTQSDPKNGVVIFHHGGTYTINGNECTETVQYANPSTMQFIGKTNGHFYIKIDGDTMTLVGIDNPWKEVWKKRTGGAGSHSEIAREMTGTWVFVGEPGNVVEPPTSGAGYKFITPTDWCDTQSDAKTGVVVIHHGGTWTMNGDEYVESVKYANPPSMSLIGNDCKFTSKLDGDTLTITGIGNPWNEVWKRVK